MAPQNEEDFNVSQGKHAAAPQPLTRREQKRAQKAAQKAAKEAAKQAKKAAKAAEKAAKKGGGVVAPVASTTAATTAWEPVKAEYAGIGAEPEPAKNAANPLNDLPTTMPVDAPAEHVHMGAAGEAEGGYVPAGTNAYEQYSRYNADGSEAPAPKRKKKKRGGVVAAICAPGCFSVQPVSSTATSTKRRTVFFIIKTFFAGMKKF